MAYPSSQAAQRLPKKGRALMRSLLLGALCAAGLALPVQARTKVVVASETWAQLIQEGSNNRPQGAIVDFIRRMNAVQDKFEFEFVVLPRLRLNQFFIDRQADVYPLRTTLWTDPALNLVATRTILTSGDVYIARRDNRYGGAAIFDHIERRQIAGVRGYHYQAFKNNADENVIKANFKADLLPNNEAVVKFIQSGRAEVGIVPESIVAQYFQDPAVRAQLIVADQFDSRVEFSNLVRRDGPISVDEMNQIIDVMAKTGDIAKLRKVLNLNP